MNCMRCGREAGGGSVFCQACREDVERHPVPPETVLVLPEKKPQPAQRRTSSKKKDPTPEEQVKRLQTQIRRLTAVLICLCLVFALFITAVIWGLLTRPREQEDDIGKNYGTMAPEDTT